EELDLGDAGLASLSGFDEGLQHFEGVEIVDFEGAAVDADGFLDGAAGGDFKFRPALRQRDRAAGPEWGAGLLAGVPHGAGPIPAKGQVLVIEDRYKAVAAAHDGDDFIEETLAGILGRAEPTDGVIAVLADRQNCIDAQVFASER